ncbi:uncharacterized protein LOC131270476 isoform X2 [Anopheles coustani]|uniref:uncharacterized protein LOC131270476 isoform X2 n=1 Tax=Anopheles coustani TaxID=139045 RepID=UPI0026598C4F|nr:uncharacterized protein LOC131270476 isoform X2 [Anopheles coustani]
MAQQQRLQPLAGDILQHQQTQQLYNEQEPMEEDEDEDVSVAGEQSSRGEKRRFYEQYDSDEDDFAGFDEDATSSENGVLNSPRAVDYLSDAILSVAERKHAEEDVDFNNTSKQDDMENTANELNKSAAKKKTNIVINTQDDVYKEPFRYGWKRELVYRANMDGNSKDKGEVYYITPQGKKLRTRNDIAAALHDDLTINNFTFVKEPVGGKPDEETIRSAKSYGNAPKRSGSGNYPYALETPPGDLGKRVPKPKMPKGASPPPPSYSRTSSQTSKGHTNASSHQVIGITKANESIGIVGKPSKSSGKSKAESCTIQCLPAMGMIPMLQCMVCFSMYHPECVNATTAEALARRFTCKSCLEESAAAEMQQQQAYKESFGKFGTSGNENGSGAAVPKPLSAPNNGGSLIANQTASSTPLPPTTLQAKEKSKRNSQQSAVAKGVITALTAPPSSNVGKDIPPQDVIVIRNHEYVVVPKGKATSVKSSKKASTKTANNSQHQIAKLPDDGRKTTNNVSSNKEVASTQDRLSDDEANAQLIVGDGPLKNHSTTVKIVHNSSTTVQHYGARDPSNFLAEVSAGYNCLMHVFDYLKVQELLRASSVCRMWNHVGNHPRFWKTVRMKNSYVKDWAGMIAKLRKNDTRHLDLRKVLNAGSNDEMWQRFIEHIGQADKIDTIDLCRCSSSVVGSLLQSNPNLRVVNALAIKNDPIDFENFEHGVHLEELRLKSSAAISLDGDLHQLGALRQLKHLSLTSIAKLGSTSIDALGSLVLLESLELGECTEIGVNLATVLPSLTALKRLRLEKGQENFDMFSVFQGISSVSSLRQLELINCDIKTGFDKYFAVCSNLKRLLLIPTYVSQSAATNRMILKGLMKLNQTLETVVWAITVELLRVTELYIDANIEDAQSQLGGSIPILKPVPGSDEPVEIASASSQPDLPEEVEIVPLKKVQSILDRRVPNTKVQILKIPFGNTWKQTMSEFT